MDESVLTVMAADKPDADGASAPEAAIESYLPDLYRFLRRRLARIGDAEVKDLLQDVYVRYLAVPHRDRILQPQRYLYRIASNLVGEYSLRKRRSPVVFDSDRATAAVESESLSGSAADDPVDHLQVRERLQQVYQGLPPMLRKVLVLYARDGLKPREIAARLKLSDETARRYVRRALAEFKNSAMDSEK